MECKRCGWCCEHSTIAVSQSDILRWNREKRISILREVSFITNYPQEGRAGFYIAKTTFNPKQPCPFFSREADLGVCGIHETKPRICVDFPTSKPKETKCPIIASSIISPAKSNCVQADQKRDFTKTDRQQKQLLHILYRVRGLPIGK